jgi:Uma2 family endonuclease
MDDRLFLRLCRVFPDHRLGRTACGDLLIRMPAGAATGMRGSHLIGKLYSWNKAARLGVAFGPSVGFKLRDGAIRDPSASWIPNERWGSLTPGIHARPEGHSPLTQLIKIQD